MIQEMNEVPSQDSYPVSRDLYTVSELVEAIRQNLESEFPRVSVVGEIANCKRHSSGHTYFTLRDSENMLHAVLFRKTAQYVTALPEDGMIVVASGKLSHFGGSGRTQIIVRDLVPSGAGAMDRAFRELLEKLRAEGLTAPERKRSISRYPEKIAVITSESGAVIRDILDTLDRRWPVAHVVHIATEVQGAAAAESIVRAFGIVNGLENIDLVILARGGGSVEDLWAFNLEAVARAVACCRYPVITGIGHEIDITICDHVSDLRAATPTAAAELATPVADEVIRELEKSTARVSDILTGRIENQRYMVDYLLRSTAISAIEYRMDRLSYELCGRLEDIISFWRRRSDDARRTIDSSCSKAIRSMEKRFERSKQTIARCSASLSARNPGLQINNSEWQLGGLLNLVDSAMSAGLNRMKANLQTAEAELEGLAPLNVLRRGYAYCSDAERGTLLPRVEAVESGKNMIVQFYDGDAKCLVESKRKGTPWRKD